MYNICICINVKCEETIPMILVEQKWPSTLANEVKTSRTTTKTYYKPETQNKDRFAVKLNHLKDKSIRHESYKNFLSRYISEEVMPKGSKLELEPTFRNLNQEFADKWYSQLKSLSLMLMKNIVTYCDKTIA